MSGDYKTKNATYLQFREADVTVAAASTTLLETIGVAELERLTFAITNNGGLGTGTGTGGGTGSGTNALDGFVVQYLFHPDGSYVTVASTSSNFSTPDWPVIIASGDPTALADGSTAWAVLDVRGVYCVRFYASASSDPMSVTIEGSGS